MIVDCSITVPDLYIFIFIWPILKPTQETTVSKL